MSVFAFTIFLILEQTHTITEEKIGENKADEE